MSASGRPTGDVHGLFYWISTFGATSKFHFTSVAAEVDGWKLRKDFCEWPIRALARNADASSDIFRVLVTFSRHSVALKRRITWIFARQRSQGCKISIKRLAPVGGRSGRPPGKFGVLFRTGPVFLTLCLSLRVRSSVGDLEAKQSSSGFLSPTLAARVDVSRGAAARRTQR